MCTLWKSSLFFMPVSMKCETHAGILNHPHTFPKSLHTSPCQPYYLAYFSGWCMVSRRLLVVSDLRTVFLGSGGGSLSRSFLYSATMSHIAARPPRRQFLYTPLYCRHPSPFGKHRIDTQYIYMPLLLQQSTHSSIFIPLTKNSSTAVSLGEKHIPCVWMIRESIRQESYRRNSNMFSTCFLLDFAIYIKNCDLRMILLWISRKSFIT